MKDCIIILSAFLAGISAAAFEFVPGIFLSDSCSFYALWCFMFIVGMSVGADESLPEIIRSITPRIMILPLATTIGTYGGVASLGYACDYDITESLAIGAGFGYYSLSSILITQYIGAGPGSVALLANMMREIIVLVFAPLIFRFAGAAPLICAGGCTTSDTTLPSIIRYAGSQWIAPAIVHAITLDFSVPFWIAFICSLR